MEKHMEKVKQMNEHKLRNPFKTYDPTQEKLPMYAHDGIGDTTVIYTATEYNKRTIKDFVIKYNKEILDIIKRTGYEYQNLTIEFYDTKPINGKEGRPEDSGTAHTYGTSAKRSKIYVNIRNKSAFIHELGHIVDSNTQDFDHPYHSMKPDFQQIADEYRERLEKLSEYETYNDNMKAYLSENIEIYARLFQCWFNEINPSYSISKMEYVDESEKLAYELYKELNLSEYFERTQTEIYKLSEAFNNDFDDSIKQVDELNNQLKL